MSGVNQRNMWPAVIIALGGLLGAGGLAVAHVDRDMILLLLGWLIVPVITALLAAQNAHQAGTLEQVKEQSNGNTTRLLDIVERQGRLLAALQPVDHEPTASAPPAPPTWPPAYGGGDGHQP